MWWMLYETELTFNYVLLIWCDAGCVVGGGMWGIVVVRFYQAPFNPWHLKVPYTHPVSKRNQNGKIYNMKLK